MSIINRPDFLRTVLLADAATCVASGLLMSVGSTFLAQMTRIPTELLFASGLSLFPITAFIAFLATRKDLWPAGVWLVILGNVGWVAGSLWLLVGGAITPNVLGSVFVAFQAAVVAALTACETIGVHRSSVLTSPRA